MQINPYDGPSAFKFTKPGQPKELPEAWLQGLMAYSGAMGCITGEGHLHHHQVLSVYVTFMQMLPL